MNKQCVIGVIGGMSKISSDYSKVMIYDEYLKKTKGQQCPLILSIDMNMNEVEVLQKSGDKEGLRKLIGFAASLVKSADFTILCTNTMHEFAYEIKEFVPLLDIREITAKAILKEGKKKVALLGTTYTMEQSFYREVLEKYGIEVVIPDKIAREKIHHIIFDELIHEKINPVSMAELIEIIANLLREEDIEAVALACTELPLLLSGDYVCTKAGRVKVFNTTRLQAMAAVNKALEIES